MCGIKKRLLKVWLFFAIAAGAISVSAALNASAAEAGDTVQYSSSMYMRAEMNEDSVTSTIVNPGEELTYLEDDGTSNGWTKVQNSNGQVGYVYSSYICDEEKQPQSSNTERTENNSRMRVVNTSMWVRSFEGDDSICLDVVSPGDEVTLISNDGTWNGWSYIRTDNGYEGYVYTQNLVDVDESAEETATEESITNQSETEETTATVINVAMWVRMFAGWDGGAVDTVYPGDSVTVLSTDGTSNGWAKIRTMSGSEGYVLTQNLTTTNTTTDNAEYTTDVSYDNVTDAASNIAEDVTTAVSDSVSVTLYNTPYGNSWYNIQLAASNLNGFELAPGELFSWEAVMGPSSVEQGFLMSKGYSGGTVVDVPGGGVCFVSTTLMQGARKYGLEIVEKWDHSLPVSYASPGDEATVSYGSCDLKFRNTTDHTVVINLSTDSSSGACTVTVSAK